jgi:hypothetical protein
MKCVEFLEHFGELLDGDGDIGIAKECDRHLRSCRCCAYVFYTTIKMIELYKNCEPPAIPDTSLIEGRRIPWRR